MSLLLHIDTAVDAASVCLSDDTRVLAHLRNDQPRESAGWLQPAIKQLLEQAGCTLPQLSAISVSAGPGSYTGLRVGMASAKGLCYALQIPLITISTLEMMTAAARRMLPEVTVFCPMIDARRMEVFTAIYNREYELLMPPQAMILDEKIAASLLVHGDICFFGNGSDKLKPLVTGSAATFATVLAGASDLVVPASERFAKQAFADLAYAEPFYIKAFYTTQSGT